jgi:hypothetical protein
LADFITSFSFLFFLWAENRPAFDQSADFIGRKVMISFFRTSDSLGTKNASKGRARASSDGAGVGAWSWLSK